MTLLTELETILTIITALFPIITALLGGKWIYAKKKMTHIRNFVVTLDEAMKDDKITNEEFDKIFNTGRAILDR